MGWDWPHIEIGRPLGLTALAVLLLVAYGWRRSLLGVSARCQLGLALCRGAVVALIAAGLASPCLVRVAHRPRVVFAVDHSASVSDQGCKAAEQFVADACASAGGGEAVVLPFAAQLASSTGDRNDSPGAVGRDATDLQAAIEAAGAEFTADRPVRFVLLSDGLQTRGSAVAAARAAVFPISTVPLDPRADPEVYASRVNAVGRRVRPDEPFDVEVLVHASRAGQGTIEMSCDGRAAGSRTVQVAPGDNRFLFPQTLPEVPEATFTARLTGFPDMIAENNAASCLVMPGPRRQVLLVEGRKDATSRLAAVLRADGLEVQALAPDRLPRDAAELDRVDLAVLSNVPAAALSPEQMEGLRDYVRRGGGLVVIGGDQSLTAGAYRGTALEEALPVRCEARRQRRRPGLALVVLIDRSTSMQGPPIALAKQATRRAVELLDPQDQIGVIAFDESPEWINPIGPCSDKGPILARIDRIEAGGRTDTLAALDRAYLALDDAYADLKHIILLTDGISHPGDFDGLARRIAAAGITLSTVAVGKEAAGPLLEELARIAHGRYYHCGDPAAVPQVFAVETASAGKVGIFEEPFFAQGQGRLSRATGPEEKSGDESPHSKEAAGPDVTEAPALLGYVETQPKPQAAVALASESGDPLLVSWAYGLGVATVFASDAEDRWAAAWLGWPGFRSFWRHVARAALRSDDGPGCAIRAEQRGTQGRVLVDAGRVLLPSPDLAAPQVGALVGGQLTAEVTGPGNVTRRIQGKEVAPGQYAAEFDAGPSGAYRIQARLSYQGREVYAARCGLVSGFTDELRTRPADEGLLREIARLSGGSFRPRPEDVFAPSEEGVASRTPLWPHLLAVAGLVFVIDVGLRRAAQRKAAQATA